MNNIFGYKTWVFSSKITANMYTLCNSVVKWITWAISKEYKRSSSILRDRSRSLIMFWKGKPLSYNWTNTVNHVGSVKG